MGSWRLDTGSPQEQIAAFRAFQIPVSMQDAFGYPALTARVQRKIFGENAARVYGVDPSAARCTISADALTQERSAWRSDPRAVPVPRERAYGPRSRREFLAFAKLEHHTERAVNARGATLSPSKRVNASASKG